MAQPATCEYCDKPMHVVTCLEGEWYGLPYDGAGGPRCSDCNVAVGGWHHPGCTVALCPDDCGNQAFDSPHIIEH